VTRVWRKRQGAQAHNPTTRASVSWYRRSLRPPSRRAGQDAGRRARARARQQNTRPAPRLRFAAAATSRAYSRSIQRRKVECGDGRAARIRPEQERLYSADQVPGRRARLYPGHRQHRGRDSVARRACRRQAGQCHVARQQSRSAPIVTYRAQARQGAPDRAAGRQTLCPTLVGRDGDDVMSGLNSTEQRWSTAAAWAPSAGSTPTT